MNNYEIVLGMYCKVHFVYMNTNIIRATIEIATYLSSGRLGSKVVWATMLLQSDIKVVVVRSHKIYEIISLRNIPFEL
jgi:hypothetical protein